MKLTINENPAITEPEVILNCAKVDGPIRLLADQIRQYAACLTGELDGVQLQLPLAQLLYLESVDKKTFLYDPGRALLCRSTLAELEPRLENACFCRISRSCIVNLAAVQGVRPYPNHRLEVLLANGEHLIAGRAYCAALRRRLADFCGGPAAVPPGGAERTVRSGGRVLRFAARPKRVAALSYGAAELLCALGAADTLAVIAPAEDTPDHLLPQYRPILEQIPLLQANGDGVPTPATLRGLGIELSVCSYYFCCLRLDHAPLDGMPPIYLMESTIPGRATLEQLYRDILALGRIFRAEDRALALAAQLRGRATALTRRLFRQKPVRVFVYDGRESAPLTALGGTLENDLITLAGGRNVFGHREGCYHEVSWAEVAAAQPEVIVVHDYWDSMTLPEKLAWLKSRPELAGCPALREGRFVALTLVEVLPGLQNLNALEKLIRALHPGAL